MSRLCFCREKRLVFTCSETLGDVLLPGTAEFYASYTESDSKSFYEDFTCDSFGSDDNSQARQQAKQRGKNRPWS